MKTPTLDKMKAVRERSQAIGEFVEWLCRKGRTICRAHDHTDACYAADDVDHDERICGMRAGTYYPEPYQIERLLAEFFEIDLDRAEHERRAILANLRRRSRA